MQRNSCEKQHPALKKKTLMTYNAGKNLTPLYVGEKILLTPEVGEKLLPQLNPLYPPPHGG